MSRNQSQLLREKNSAARGNVRAFTVTNNNGTSSFCKTNTESDTRNENLHKRAEITHTQRAVQSVTDTVQGGDL